MSAAVIQKERSPRILFVGDAVVSSGFARCTHAVCDELWRAGWDVHVLGLSYYGDPHPYPYRIYPCYQPLDSGRDNWGVSRLPWLMERLAPDVIVLLNDPWNVPEYLIAIEGFVRRRAKQEIEVKVPPIVGWLAVDAENQKGAPLNKLAHVAVWTEFAKTELERGGYEGECSVVPLGVDLDVFSPKDRAKSRSMVLPETVPQDAFVVGFVGRNQPRKRIDLLIDYFAEWIRRDKVDDAYLFLHVAPTGDAECDVRSLVRYHDVPKGRIVLCESPLGEGQPISVMANVYSAMDVFATTTQGEGWGLPVLEAMACGVPCIVPDWSGLASWVRDAAVRVACTSKALNAPLNGGAYTVGGIPDRSAFIEELRAMYRSELHRQTHRKRGLRLAQRLTWKASGVGMRRVLERVLAEVEASGSEDEGEAKVEVVRDGTA